MRHRRSDLRVGFKGDRTGGREREEERENFLHTLEFQSEQLKKG
jgi:hypothetical protein